MKQALVDISVKSEVHWRIHKLQGNSKVFWYRCASSFWSVCCDGLGVLCTKQGNLFWLLVCPITLHKSFRKKKKSKKSSPSPQTKTKLTQPNQTKTTQNLICSGTYFQNVMLPVLKNKSAVWRSIFFPLSIFYEGLSVEQCSSSWIRGTDFKLWIYIYLKSTHFSQEFRFIELLIR